MRIWSLHPKYLDRHGLLACWREIFLAQKVLSGETRGYRNHPQLLRFRACPGPLAAIATYLVSVADEAETRGDAFNQAKITSGRVTYKIPVMRGQLQYEWEHLKAKLTGRDPLWLSRVFDLKMPESHPLFEVIEGSLELWEKIH
jgi:Pyrimidine dimer DNA glycosylase